MKRDQAEAYTGLAVGGCEYKGGRSEEGGSDLFKGYLLPRQTVRVPS